MIGRWIMLNGNNNYNCYFLLAKKWLEDLFFPVSCLNCGREGEWLCVSCRSAIDCHKNRFCPVCKRIKDDCSPCESCRDKIILNGLWIVASYDNELIQKIISAIKYEFVEDLSSYLDDLFKNYFGNKNDWQHNAVLVPVPLHRKRFLNRGFNQAQLICQSLNRVFGNEIESGIISRIINSQPQAKLNSADRQNNVRGIFKVNEFKCGLLDREIVLVDDVYTTGATMGECAGILKRAGFKQITALVLARGT